MDPFHEQLARIALSEGAGLGLMLAGGYAISAHKLTSRPSQDLDFASASSLPLVEVSERLAEVYRVAGFGVRVIETDPTASRFVVYGGDMACEIDLLKVGVGPPTLLDIGPVVNRDDAVGLKVAALYDRSQHRDFIDVYAAYHRGGYSLRDLERLGAVHKRGFNLPDLLFRLEALELLDDRRFTAYGLTEDDVSAVYQWAQTWVGDLRQRLATEDHSPTPLQDEPDWDTYLEGG